MTLPTTLMVYKGQNGQIQPGKQLALLDLELGKSKISEWYIFAMNRKLLVEILASGFNMNPASRLVNG